MKLEKKQVVDSLRQQIGWMKMHANGAKQAAAQIGDRELQKEVDVACDETIVKADALSALITKKTEG